MASVFQRAIKYLTNLENRIIDVFSFRFPLDGLVPAVINLPQKPQNQHRSTSLNDILKDSITWAVPARRRTIEKRRSRRFGILKYVYKPYLPKTNILTCSQCGSSKTAGHLCPVCYAKIKAETELIQNEIKKELGLSPVETEVVVLYEGEKNENKEFYQGMRIIEMKKQRPQLFCNNLLQPTTHQLSDSKEVAKVPDIELKEVKEPEKK